MLPPNSERKYQAIKLYNSGVISLSDLKALYRVVHVAAEDEYSRREDIDNVLAVSTRLDKLTRLSQTRYEAKQQALARYSRRPRHQSKQEALAAFVTGVRGRRDWKRFGPLIARSNNRAEPRPGSSKGKIAQTTYRGWTSTRRGLDTLIATLEKILLAGDSPRAAVARQAAMAAAGLDISVFAGPRRFSRTAANRTNGSEFSSRLL